MTLRTSGSSRTLRVAIPDLVSPSYFPAIAAVELGCFRQEGLDATIELLFPITRTYEELRDGTAQDRSPEQGAHRDGIHGLHVRRKLACAGSCTAVA